MSWELEMFDYHSFGGTAGSLISTSCSHCGCYVLKLYRNVSYVWHFNIDRS